MLENDVVKLRLIEPEDYELIRSWRTNTEEYESFFDFKPVTIRQNECFYENLLNSDEYNFCIICKDFNEVIGTISILNIDYRNRKAEMGRVLIGNKRYRGKGLIKSAIELIKEYSFNHLNMRKLYCQVFEYNIHAQKAYTAMGFEKEAILKEHIYKNGKYENIMIYSLINK